MAAPAMTAAKRITTRVIIIDYHNGARGLVRNSALQWMIPNLVLVLGLAIVIVLVFDADGNGVNEAADGCSWLSIA